MKHFVCVTSMHKHKQRLTQPSNFRSEVNAETLLFKPMVVHTTGQVHRLMPTQQPSSQTRCPQPSGKRGATRLKAIKPKLPETFTYPIPPNKFSSTHLRLIQRK